MSDTTVMWVTILGNVIPVIVLGVVIAFSRRLSHFRDNEIKHINSSLKGLREQGQRIEDSVHQINGRLGRIEQWSRDHEKLDEQRFTSFSQQISDVKEDIGKIETGE